jgi:hypothetical protein
LLSLKVGAENQVRGGEEVLPNLRVSVGPKVVNVAVERSAASCPDVINRIGDAVVDDVAVGVGYLARRTVDDLNPGRCRGAKLGLR